MKISALALAASLAAFVALPGHAADNPFAGESFKMAASEGGKCGGMKPTGNDGPKCGGTAKPAGGKCGGLKPAAGGKCGGMKPTGNDAPKCGGTDKPAADKAPPK